MSQRDTWNATAGQYDQAIEHYRRMLAMVPTFALGHVRIAHTYEQKGMLAEAIAEFTKASELSRGQTGVASLAHALALAGRVGEAREFSGDWNRRRDPQPMTSLS